MCSLTLIINCYFNLLTDKFIHFLRTLINKNDMDVIFAEMPSYLNVRRLSTADGNILNFAFEIIKNLYKSYESQYI